MGTNNERWGLEKKAEVRSTEAGKYAGTWELEGNGDLLQV
jgi:hypothetical protein